MSNRNEQIVARYQDGYSIVDVGIEFGITRERVRQLLVAAGITERHGGRRRRERLETQIQNAFARIIEGQSTVKDAAEILGWKPDTLRTHFRRRGLQVPLAVAQHGTRHYYMKYACRCELCRAAVRAHARALKQREPPEHGTASAYHNYGCRCVPCRAAGREARRAQKRRRLERGFQGQDDRSIRTG